MTEKLNIKQLKPISTDVNLGTSDALLPTQKAVKTYVDTADSALQTKIDALSGRGRFLSLWNCVTGLPETNPETSPYEYKSGDYYIVGTVSSTEPAVNYKPDGTEYVSGVASTTLETNEVYVNDTYLYDGENWVFQSNTQKEVSFSVLAGSPYDNTNLSSALNSKANVSALTAHTSDTSNPHQVTKTQVGLGNVDNTSDLDKPISIATQTALNDKQATISDLATIRSGASAGASAYTTIQGYGNIVTHNVSEFATSAQGALADTALQSGDNVSELVNDAGYITGITGSDVITALGYTPYNSSNPSGYQANVIESIKVNGIAQTITAKAVDITVPTKTSDLNNDSGFITKSVNDLTNYTLSVNLASVATTGTLASLTDVNTTGATSGQFLMWNGTAWVPQSSSSTVAWGAITGTLSDQSDLQNALDAKQATLTAGDGIDITSNTISVSDLDCGTLS